MFFKIAVLLLLPHLSACEDPFWLTVELVNVEWRVGCLTTGGCAEPRFKLTETNLASNEQASISWSILDDFSQDHSHNYVSHWKRGHPSDVSLLCEVVGIDPTYGFPRVCDATASVQMFQMKPIQQLITRARRSEIPDSGKGKVVVELKGKCFNASVTVERHEQRCPWCQEEKQESLAFVAQTEHEIGNGTDPSSHLLDRRSQLLPVALAVLASVALLSTAAFAFLFLTLMKQRRFASETRKCKVETFYPSKILADTVKINEDARYETLGDQQYPTLPYWLSSANSLGYSTTDALPYTSESFVYPFAEASTGTESGQCKFPSLNDSGLESV